MKDGYTLPYQLGSKFVTKVCITQSLYFKWSMYNVLDKALGMEKEHGPHRDPKLLERSADYKEYGPLGGCVKMREAYFDLVTAKQWPALAATIPAANLGSVTEDDGGPRKNANGRKYFYCGSVFHLRGHSDCPKTKTASSPRDDISTGGKGSGD